MAVRNVSAISSAVATVSATWSGLLTTDTGAPFELPGYTERSFQVSGTFGGASVTIQGSNDGANWFSLEDANGDPLTFTVAGGAAAEGSTVFVRPAVTGGGGTTSLSVVGLFVKVRRTETTVGQGGGGGGAVQSVAGRTGAVTLAVADVANAASEAFAASEADGARAYVNERPVHFATQADVTAWNGLAITADVIICHGRATEGDARAHRFVRVGGVGDYFEIDEDNPPLEAFGGLGVKPARITRVDGTSLPYSQQLPRVGSPGVGWPTVDCADALEAASKYLLDTGRQGNWIEVGNKLYRLSRTVTLGSGVGLRGARVPVVPTSYLQFNRIGSAFVMDEGAELRTTDAAFVRFLTVFSALQAQDMSGYAARRRRHDAFTGVGIRHTGPGANYERVHVFGFEQAMDIDDCEASTFRHIRVDGVSGFKAANAGQVPFLSHGHAKDYCTDGVPGKDWVNPVVAVMQGAAGATRVVFLYPTGGDPAQDNAKVSLAGIRVSSGAEMNGNGLPVKRGGSRVTVGGLLVPTTPVIGTQTATALVAVSRSDVLTVTVANHDLKVGDFVTWDTISGGARTSTTLTAGGQSMAGDFTVQTVTDFTTFTVKLGSAAASSETVSTPTTMTKFDRRAANLCALYTYDFTSRSWISDRTYGLDAVVGPPALPAATGTFTALSSKYRVPGIAVFDRAAPLAITAATRAAGVVTLSVGNHPFGIGDLITVAGAGAFSATGVAVTAVSETTVSYNLAGANASLGAGGTVTGPAGVVIECGFEPDVDDGHDFTIINAEPAASTAWLGSPAAAWTARNVPGQPRKLELRTREKSPIERHKQVSEGAAAFVSGAATYQATPDFLGCSLFFFGAFRAGIAWDFDNVDAIRAGDLYGWGFRVRYRMRCGFAQFTNCGGGIEGTAEEPTSIGVILEDTCNDLNWRGGEQPNNGLGVWCRVLSRSAVNAFHGMAVLGGYSGEQVRVDSGTLRMPDCEVAAVPGFANVVYMGDDAVSLELGGEAPDLIIKGDNAAAIGRVYLDAAIRSRTDRTLMNTSWHLGFGTVDGSGAVRTMIRADAEGFHALPLRSNTVAELDALLTDAVVPAGTVALDQSGNVVKLNAGRTAWVPLVGGGGVPLIANTTNATPKSLTTNGLPIDPSGANIEDLRTNASSVRVRITGTVSALVVATGAYALWDVDVLLTREGGPSLTEVSGGGSSILPKLSRGVGSAWRLALTADVGGTDSGLVVTGTGADATVIDWRFVPTRTNLL